MKLPGKVKKKKSLEWPQTALYTEKSETSKVTTKEVFVPSVWVDGSATFLKEKCWPKPTENKGKKISKQKQS